MGLSLALPDLRVQELICMPLGFVFRELRARRPRFVLPLPVLEVLPLRWVLLQVLICEPLRVLKILCNIEYPDLVLESTLPGPVQEQCERKG